MELGDIGAALQALDVIVEAAVIAVPDENVTNRLRADVTVNQPLSNPGIIQSLRERLPPYMIPDEIVPPGASETDDREDRPAGIAELVAEGVTQW